MKLSEYKKSMINQIKVSFLFASPKLDEILDRGFAGFKNLLVREIEMLFLQTNQAKYTKSKEYELYVNNPPTEEFIDFNNHYFISYLERVSKVSFRKKILHHLKELR